MGSLLIIRLHDRSSIHRGLATHVQLALKLVAAEVVSNAATVDTALQSTLIFSKASLTDGRTTGTLSVTAAGIVVESIHLTPAGR